MNIFLNIFFSGKEFAISLLSGCQTPQYVVVDKMLKKPWKTAWNATFRRIHR